MAENNLAKSLLATTHALRIRWAAIGAAIAVSLGGGVTLFAQAGAAPATSSTFVSVSPIRVLDTRDAVVLWAGPFVTGVPHDVKVTGVIPTSSGTQTVMPSGATGVVLNVTVVNSSADGYVSVRPADAIGAPQTSNINFEARKTVANSITVNLPTSGPDAGTFEVWFDSMGVANATADILVDVTGYYTANALDLKSDAIAIIGSGGEDFGDIQMTSDFSGIVWDNGHWNTIFSFEVPSYSLYFESTDCSGTPWQEAWSPEFFPVFNNNVGTYFEKLYTDSVTADVNNFHSVLNGSCDTDLLPAAFKAGGVYWNANSGRNEDETEYLKANPTGPTSATMNAIWAHVSGINDGVNSFSFVPRSSLNAAG